MKILHLSDIHYDVRNKAKFNELLSEIMKCIKEVELIVITGDLINRGNAGCKSIEEGYDIFDKEFIGPILSHFSIDRKQVILVPGNHDIDRKRINEAAEIGLQKLLIDDEKVSEIIKLGLEMKPYQEFERLEAYKKYVKSFYKNSKESKITLFHDTHTLCIDGVQIGITSFNTAWRCSSSKSDVEKLILGLEQCLVAIDDIKNCDIKIGLMHHELSYLQQLDYEKVEPRIRKKYDLLCYGHVHSGDCSSYCSANGEVINFVSPGFCTENMFTENSKYDIGFSVINIDTESGNIDAEYYKWSQKNTEFIINHEIKFDTPKKLRSYNSRKNIYSSENTIMERDTEHDKSFPNNKLIHEKTIINNIKKNQSNLVESKGVLYKNSKEIKEILGRLGEYYKFSFEIDFILLYADKIIYDEKYIISKIESIFINNVVLTDKVINVEVFQEIIELLNEWLNLLHGFCNNREEDYIQILKKCKDFCNTSVIDVIDVIEQILIDRNIQNIVDDYPEKKKKEMLVVGFILPLLYVSSVKNVYFDLNEEKFEDVANDCNYIERNVDDLIFNSFISNDKTLLYGKIGIGKSTSAKNIKCKLEENDKLQICIYFSFLFQTIQDNIRLFLETCNNRLIVNTINEIEDGANVEDIYIELLSKTFDNLLREYKNVFIIMDNIDSINIGLFNIIVNIKTDCHYLFVINDKHFHISNDNKDINLISFPEFTSEELKKFTINDSETAASLSEIGLEFGLNSESKNNVIDIKNLIDGKKNNKNYMYYSNANKWISLSQSYKEEIFILLSIFSKVCPLNIEQIQKYILTHNIYVKKPYIKQTIINFEEQFAHNNYSSIKFRDEDFVEFICRDYFSQYDMEVALNKIFKWIGELDFSNSTLIAFLIANIGKIEFGRPDLINKLQQNLNEVLYKKRDGELLYSIGQTIYNEFLEQRETAVIYIEKASDNECIKATEFLIEYYLKKNQNDNSIKAKKLIKQALEFNSEKAKFSYVFGILEEKFIEEEDTFDKVMEILKDLSLNAKDDFIRNRSDLLYCVNTIKGYSSDLTYDGVKEKIIKLAKEDNLAKVYYAKYLIDSNEENNIQDAESTLLSLSDNGLIPAKVELIKLYFSDKARIFNYKKAVELIKSINEDITSEVESFILDAYFNDKFTEKDKDYIDSYITKKLEENDEEFVAVYALELLYGNQKYKNLSEGKKCLEKLAINNNIDAMYLLGRYLLKNEPQNIEGITLLEKAALSNSVNAQLRLAKIYLDENSPHYDYNKGFSLYNKMINKGYIDAILEYSKYMLKSETVDNNKKYDAEKKLSYYAKLGNIKAVKILSKIYLDKKYGVYNTNKGEYYLTLAIQKGDISSISNLAQRYLYGLGLEKNLDKATELLNNGIKKDDAFCMSILAKAILENTLYNCNESEGMQLLLKAFKLNDNLAKMYYGDFLCKGKYFNQNKELGEKLLIESSKLYDEAKLILSKMKLDGKYLSKNTEEGLKFLLDAVNNGFEYAKIEYAERLLDGNQISIDVSKGLNILKQLINSDSDYAKIIYAEKLLTQKYGEKELEARNILNELINSNKTAKRVYAVNLLDKKLEYDLTKELREDKAICMLLENIEDNDIHSIYIMGNYYLDGEKVTKNVSKGIDILELGVEKQSTECIRDLGDELVKGEIIERNNVRGTRLLCTAYKRGDLKAKFLYAKYNIEGILIKDSNLEEGWEIMKQLSEDNYIDAKLYIGNACIKGSYREKNVKFGTSIFQNLIEDKNEIACIAYSNILSNGQYVEQDIKKSQKILQVALNKPESHLAKYEKIQKMYEGKWKNNSIKKAAKELEILAKSGSQKAKFELAIRQITGNGLAKNEKKGKESLKNIIKDISMMSAFSFGMVAYKLKVYDIASDMFDIAIQSENNTCKNALAYIIRKKQYTNDVSKYKVFDLLKPLCDAKYPIGLINYALYLVQGVKEDGKWREADELVKGIHYYDDCFEWWYELMKQGDDEGKLVIAWLIRNNIYLDMDKTQIASLIKNLDGEIWNIPDWFYQ